MNEKTSINSLYPNLRAPTAGLLQGLIVMQQCVYQIKFRNVCEIKKRLVQPWLVWSRTISILLSMNGESVSLSVRIVGQYSNHFYCRQLKMDNWMKCHPKCQKYEQNMFLRVMLIKQSYRIGQKSDISLVVFSPDSAKTNVRWGGN